MIFNFFLCFRNLLNYTGCDTNILIKAFLELYNKKISPLEVQSQVKLKSKNKIKVQNVSILISNACFYLSKTPTTRAKNVCSSVCMCIVTRSENLLQRFCLFFK